MKKIMNKQIKLIVFLLILLCFSLTAFSQEDEPAKVRGKVTNYFGSPVDNVEVKFFLLEKKSGKYISAQGKFVKSSSTNKDGEYEISGLPWGEYRVEASSTEIWKFYLWRNAERVLDLGLYQGDIHGYPQLEVSGKIRLENKKPAQDATVTLINAFDTTDVKQTLTDKNGNYKIQLIQPGQYIIYVTKSEFAVASFSFLINGIAWTGYPKTETDKKIDLQLVPITKPNSKK